MMELKKILIYIIMLGSLFLRAQDPNYKGPAKMDVVSFWRQAALVKTGKATSTTLSNLEKSLASVKQKDPTYSTSTMEDMIQLCKEKIAKDKSSEATQKEAQENALIEGKKELQEKNEEAIAADKARKDKIAANMDASRNQTQNKLKMEKRFDAVFNVASFSFSNLENAQAENNAYKKEIDELVGLKEERLAYVLQMKKSGEYDRFVGKMKISYDRNFDVFIEKVDRVMAQSTGSGDENWKNCYYELQAEQMRWDAAQQVFPEEPKFGDAYKKVTEKVNQYGSLDKIASKNKENNSEKIRNQKLPAAVVKDAALEKMFVDAFNKRYAAEYKGVAYKAVNLQSEWQVEHHAISGLVVGRIRQAAIVYKTEEGKCFLVSIVHLYQDYVGTSFQNTRAVYAQNGQEMLCENVK